MLPRSCCTRWWPSWKRQRSPALWAFCWQSRPLLVWQKSWSFAGCFFEPSGFAVPKSASFAKGSSPLKVHPIDTQQPSLPSQATCQVDWISCVVPQVILKRYRWNCSETIWETLFVQKFAHRVIVGTVLRQSGRPILYKTLPSARDEP